MASTWEHNVQYDSTGFDTGMIYHRWVSCSIAYCEGHVGTRWACIVFNTWLQLQLLFHFSLKAEWGLPPSLLQSVITATEPADRKVSHSCTPLSKIQTQVHIVLYVVQRTVASLVGPSTLGQIWVWLPEWILELRLEF